MFKDGAIEECQLPSGLKFSAIAPYNETWTGHIRGAEMDAPTSDYGKLAVKMMKLSEQIKVPPKGPENLTNLLFPMGRQKFRKEEVKYFGKHFETADMHVTTRLKFKFLFRKPLTQEEVDELEEYKYAKVTFDKDDAYLVIAFEMIDERYRTQKIETVKYDEVHQAKRKQTRRCRGGQEACGGDGDSDSSDYDDFFAYCLYEENMTVETEMVDPKATNNYDILSNLAILLMTLLLVFSFFIEGVVYVLVEMLQQKKMTYAMKWNSIISHDASGGGQQPKTKIEN